MFHDKSSSLAMVSWTYWSPVTYLVCVCVVMCVMEQGDLWGVKSQQQTLKMPKCFFKPCFQGAHPPLWPSTSVPHKRHGTSFIHGGSHFNTFQLLCTKP
jgi:hypothetical protein